MFFIAVTLTLWPVFAGYGSVIQMYPGGGPVRTATTCFGFPDTFFHTLNEFPLSKVKSLLSGTFSLKMSPSEPGDTMPVAEDSNGSLDDKQLSRQETERDCDTEAPLESNQPVEKAIVEGEAFEDDKAKGTVRVLPASLLECC